MKYFEELKDIVENDGRYAYEAYEFLIDALKHTQRTLGKMARSEEDEGQCHVSSQELLDGLREFALREFGLMAPVVFRSWGVRRTDDFGEIVFKMVESEKWSKTDSDTRADFHEVYDLERITDGFVIPVEDSP